MDALRRTSTLRRVATTASLAALFLAPASADAARGHKAQKPKSPVITSVSPLRAMVGQTLTIRGRNFRKGKGRNSVGFKRDGAPVVFIKSDVSTHKVMYVKLSAKLAKVLYGGQGARFHLRVLAGRFGRQYTSNKLSPMIRPRPEDVDNGPDKPGNGNGNGNPKPQFDPAGPQGDCDGDKVLNKDETGGTGPDGDIDNDLLTNARENEIGTNGCDADSDDDGVVDSYEYKSAIDLNDDDFQHPNPDTSLPYPGKRPYPNPLNADSTTDYDGDVLTMGEEYDLWSKQGGRTANETPANFSAQHLTYSDGLQYSVYETCPSATNPAACGGADANRRVPALKADDPNGKQAEFLAWASASGYGTVHLQDGGEVWWSHVARGSYDIRNVNLDSGVSDGCGSPASPTASTDYGERLYFDFDCDGFLSDDERDEDADGLTNYDEAHGRLTPEFWAGCYDKEVAYPVAYAGTSMTDADSDGDGVRDGADDQDHDDLPNLMELSRFRASVGQAPVDPVTNPLGYYNDTEGRLCKPIQGLDPTAPNHPNAYGKVQPFDPCDPMPSSRTCQRHPVLGTDPDPNWWSLQ